MGSAECSKFGMGAPHTAEGKEMAYFVKNKELIIRREMPNRKRSTLSQVFICLAAFHRLPLTHASNRGNGTEGGTEKLKRNIVVCKCDGS